MKYTVSAVLIIFLSSCNWVEENVWGTPESKLEKTIIEDVSTDIFQLDGNYKSEQGTDITSSEISFHVDGLSDTKGRFNSFTIELNADKEKALLSMHVNIKSSSIFTDNKIRDEHLLNEEFFNTEEFPVIAFKSKDICLLDSSYIAKGKLSLVGKESKIDVPFSYLGSSTDSLGEPIYIFEGEVEFDRTFHGMQEAQSVGNLVKLHFYTELKKQ